jgi:hypothetical protein
MVPSHCMMKNLRSERKETKEYEAHLSDPSIASRPRGI